MAMFHWFNRREKDDFSFTLSFSSLKWKVEVVIMSESLESRRRRCGEKCSSVYLFIYLVNWGEQLLHRWCSSTVRALAVSQWEEQQHLSTVSQGRDTLGPNCALLRDIAKVSVQPVRTIVFAAVHHWSAPFTLKSACAGQSKTAPSLTYLRHWALNYLNITTQRALFSSLL